MFLLRSSACGLIPRMTLLLNRSTHLYHWARLGKVLTHDRLVCFRSSFAYCSYQFIASCLALICLFTPLWVLRSLSKVVDLCLSIKLSLVSQTSSSLTCLFSYQTASVWTLVLWPFCSYLSSRVNLKFQRLSWPYSGVCWSYSLSSAYSLFSMQNCTCFPQTCTLVHLLYSRHWSSGCPWSWNSLLVGIWLSFGPVSSNWQVKQAIWSKRTFPVRVPLLISSSTNMTTTSPQRHFSAQGCSSLSKPHRSYPTT